MKLGKVIGKVWLTVKDQSLEGKRIFLVQPLDRNKQPDGDPVVTVDAVGTGVGDTIYWVTGREGCFPFLPQQQVTSEATIVGIADQVNRNIDLDADT